MLQAKRSPDERHRATLLKGFFVRAKGGFYHDGQFATLDDVGAITSSRFPPSVLS